MGLGNMFSKVFNRGGGGDTEGGGQEGVAQREEWLPGASSNEAGRGEDREHEAVGAASTESPETTAASSGVPGGTMYADASSARGESESVEAGDAPLSKEFVLERLSEIYDPEIPIDIVNLGLIYEVEVDGANVHVQMTMTSPGCPTSAQIAQECQLVIEEIDGVEEAWIEIVWDPPWDPSKMSPEARESLGM